MKTLICSLIFFASLTTQVQTQTASGPPPPAAPVAVLGSNLKVIENRILELFSETAIEMHFKMTTLGTIPMGGDKFSGIKRCAPSLAFEDTDASPPAGQTLKAFETALGHIAPGVTMSPCQPMARESGRLYHCNIGMESAPPGHYLVPVATLIKSAPRSTNAFVQICILN